ncbi:MAG: UDP-N-acetylmuramoyl-tripeptide--D-alanyl-D-alanine ligase [Lentisphaeria bacterium]|nr:UDP-N-acetylmuramoyl-tripeptide--D-alanyl-D-alanine ligase [Lentisphaeria bacterium]
MLFTGKELESCLEENSCSFLNLSSGELPDIEEISTDSRKEMKNALFIALDGEKFDAHDFIASAGKNGAVLVCADRKKADKVPPNFPAVLADSPLKIYQALAKNHRNRFKNLKLVGLTGSCGKTSTKEALRAIFLRHAGEGKVLATEGNSNNQIGVPQNLFRLRQEHEYAIIEMGTNHFGEIRPLAEMAHPDAAMVVSIGSCHLEFLKDFNGVATEKGEIFSFLPPGAPVVLPFRCPAVEVLREAAKKRTENITTFGEEKGSDVRCTYLGGDLDGASFLLETKDGKSVKVHSPVPGRHQALNAAGAAAMALALGIPLDEIGEGLAKTVLPGMRMRKTMHDGALYLNDAYNANPDSMRASLTWLSEFADKEKTVLVLGDMGELGENALREHIKVLSLAKELFPSSRIICIGAMMREACEVNSLLSGGKNVETFPDASSAVSAVRSAARPGMMLFLKASRSMQFEKLEPSAGA